MYELYLDIVVVFMFYPNAKSAICRMWQNKHNHDLHFILSFMSGSFLMFSTVTSHLSTTTTTIVVWESIYVELFLLKGNPSAQFT